VPASTVSPTVNALSIPFVLYSHPRSTTPDSQNWTTWLEITQALSAESAIETACTVDDCAGHKCPHKLGPAFSPCRVRETRRGDNAIDAGLVALDIDDLDEAGKTRTIDRLSELGLAYCAYTTHSRTGLRVVMPCDRLVPASEWRAFWCALVPWLELPNIDGKTGDPTRLFFLPSKPRGGSVESWSHLGKAIVVDEILNVKRIYSKESNKKRAAEAPFPAQVPDYWPSLEARLDEARKWLEEAPVAVDGQKGSSVAYHVCCRMIALGVPREEALDLLMEPGGWNSRCTPPWGDEEVGAADSLPRKFDEALKRSGAVWGEEWERRIILGLGRDMLVLKIDRGNARECSDRVIAECLSRVEIFVRGNELVRVVPRGKEAERSKMRASGWALEQSKGDAASATESPMLMPIKDPITFVGSDIGVRFQRFFETDGKLKTVDFPDRVAKAILANGVWPGVRRISGISTVPFLRADGSICGEPGYDASTGIYYFAREAIEVPVRHSISRDNAIDARNRLIDVVEDFPFEDVLDLSVWFAFLLSLVCRPAFGRAPAFVFDAAASRTGKTLLTRTACLIGLGELAPSIAWVDDNDEMRKQLATHARAGTPVLIIDNVPSGAPIGWAVLDMALTSGRITDRALGTNQLIDVEYAPIIAATGNNVRVRGDMGGRSLRCRVIANTARPELRDEFVHPDLVEWTKRNQTSLLRDVLTIARGFFDTTPAVKAKQIGSFERWCYIVSRCCVWLDLPDPGEALMSNEMLEVDSEQVALMEFAQAYAALGAEGSTEWLTTVHANQTVADAPRRAAYHRALLALMDGHKEISGYTLGHRLAKHRDRWIQTASGEARLRRRRRDSTSKGVWYVESKK